MPSSEARAGASAMAAVGVLMVMMVADSFALLGFGSMVLAVEVTCGRTVEVTGGSAMVLEPCVCRRRLGAEVEVAAHGGAEKVVG